MVAGHAVLELRAGAGWIEAAPVVLDQPDSVVPFAVGTVGLGF